MSFPHANSLNDNDAVTCQTVLVIFQNPQMCTQLDLRFLRFNTRNRFSTLSRLSTENGPDPDKLIGPMKMKSCNTHSLVCFFVGGQKN